jgi:hypothetical protein
VLAPLSKNPEQGAVKRLEHEYSLRNKCTVDIVGDDAGFRRALQRLLRAYGFGTLTFAFAQEFLHGSAPAGAV